MLEVLGNAVDELVSCVDTPGVGLTDVELHLSVVELQRNIDRLNAVQSRLLAVWDSRKIWADDGSKSVSHRLSRETGMSVGGAKHLVLRSRRLSSMPLCMTSFLNGELSTSRVDLLVRVNQPALLSQFVEDEEMLVEMTKNLSFSDASKALSYWAQCADESRSDSKAQKQLESRSADVARTFEGTVDLRSLFDPVSGEIFLNEFEAIEKELFEADWKKAKLIHGELVTHGLLERTNSQRRCDALVEMAKRSASSGAGQVSKPLITVLVGYETFAGRVCELASGTVISPSQVVGLLEEADIERIVFDGPSRIIDMGHKRNFKGALRRAIEIRDRHCQDPSGCDVPAKNCEVDHIHPWSWGNPTNQFNGQLLCPTHNRGKGAGPPAPSPSRAA